MTTPLRVRGVYLLLVAAMLLPGRRAIAQGFQQPTLISGIATVGSISDQMTFQWNAVSGATYYGLWTKDGAGKESDQWYTSDATNCGAGQATCSLTIDGTLPPGTNWWAIQAWKPGAYSWRSAAQIISRVVT